MRVWSLQATAGAGWVREVLDDGHLIVTARAEEAAEWSSHDEAAAVATRINQSRRRVPVQVVERSATPGGPYRFQPT